MAVTSAATTMTGFPGGGGVVKSRFLSCFLSSGNVGPNPHTLLPPNLHRTHKLLLLPRAADSTQSSSILADKPTVPDDEFSLAKVSFGVIGLGVGVSLLSEHRVLTVIDPFNDEAAMLDPLFKGNRNVAWKQCVENSLKIHASSKERRPRKSVNWKIVKVPKQKDGSQCGFYVMTYMKEIIMHHALDTVHLLDNVFKIKDYVKKDIDEMRTEWAETVQEFMHA